MRTDTVANIYDKYVYRSEPRFTAGFSTRRLAEGLIYGSAMHDSTLFPTASQFTRESGEYGRLA